MEEGREGTALGAFGPDRAMGLGTLNTHTTSREIYNVQTTTVSCTKAVQSLRLNISCLPSRSKKSYAETSNQATYRSFAHTWQHRAWSRSSPLTQLARPAVSRTSRGADSPSPSAAATAAANVSSAFRTPVPDTAVAAEQGRGKGLSSRWG